MRRLVSLAVSVVLLALLYAMIDLDALAAAIAAADVRWLTVGLLMVVPLTLITAWRFTVLVAQARVGLGESSRLVLAASTLNLFLPSKLGDLAKAYVLSAKHGVSGELALSIVVFEKALDMLSLLLLGAGATIYVGLSRPWMMGFAALILALLGLLLVMILPLPIFPRLIGLAASPLPQAVAEKIGRFADSMATVAAWFWQRWQRAAGVLALSVVLWGGHLLQFWVFTRAAGGVVPVLDTMAFATLSILVGLLPLTLAGIGSRDLAIVYFFSPFLSPAVGAFLGILATLRYLLPAIAGIPFVGELAAAARRSHVADDRRSGVGTA